MRVDRLDLIWPFGFLLWYRCKILKLIGFLPIMQKLPENVGRRDSVEEKCDVGTNTHGFCTIP